MQCVFVCVKDTTCETRLNDSLEASRQRWKQRCAGLLEVGNAKRNQKKPKEVRTDGQVGLRFDREIYQLTSGPESPDRM